ncbi:MAG: sensor histidine kinase N-terminal domain-containing protein [Pseudomonadota bacterium]|nr:sensor histidine kinase N-terminal domain-containing protein [Pseudomonadota bacterium]
MKLFQRTQRSLFGEILDWMLTPLLLLWPISLALTWLVAQNLANKPFDRALVYNVQALAQFIQTSPGGRVRFSLPQPASELLRADDSDNVYYQVLGARGEFLSGERDLPKPPAVTSDAGNTALNEDVFGEPRLRDAEFRGLPVRVAYLWLPIGDGTRQALVQVAETREKRSVLAAEIIKGVMLPQFAILPLAVLLVWLALVRGIKPLSALASRIRARQPDDLSPLDDQAVPQEVGPLVASVNDLLTRLKDSIGMQKRFLADAAHQLKTPLAGLALQADLAQRQEASADDLKQSLQQIGHASVRATHTVNQLLALARAEAGGAVMAQQPCDMARLIIDVVREAVPHAMHQRIDLGYDGPEPGAPELTLRGNPTLLKEMVRNLVENAIHYTPSTEQVPGVVTVRLRVEPFSHALAVQVEDNGPGIPAIERLAVFQPFYRALGTNVHGSGLGLPIVQEIAAQHRAEVSVDDAHPGQQPPGACFTVRFAALG